MQLKLRINTSPERIAVVRNEIEHGSEPRAQFYSMVAVSTGIATFGLTMNNTAVVIGAMLVAPLMTPIFGIALSLVRGDAALLGRSIKAEVAGVFLSVFMAICIGFLIPELDVTDEMLGRTAPNLLDLLVAIFAGTAGAYAMIDECISPALPGVAISTAIVPPLANTGLCIQLEAFQGAAGSFLLFFANFLSILLVASVIFFAAGMAREFRESKKDIFRRFSLAAIGFIMVTAFLSVELNKINKNRHMEDVIDIVLSEQLAKFPATSIQEIRHERDNENIYILAHVHSPTMFSPARVKKIQTQLEENLEQPIQLYIRSTLTKDVSATGAINPMLNNTLDGLLFDRHPNERIRTLKLAEQAIRENFANHLGRELIGVNLLHLNNIKVLKAAVHGFKTLSNKEIVALESEVQQRTGDKTINLLIEFNKLDLYDRWGKFNYEWLNLGGWSVKEEADFDLLATVLQQTFKSNDYFLNSIDFRVIDDEYHLILDIIGPQLFSKPELLKLKKNLSNHINKPLKLFVHSKPEIVVSEDGFTSFEELKSKYRQQVESTYIYETKKILDEAY